MHDLAPDVTVLSVSRDVVKHIVDLRKGPFDLRTADDRRRAKVLAASEAPVWGPSEEGRRAEEVMDTMWTEAVWRNDPAACLWFLDRAPSSAAHGSWVRLTKSMANRYLGLCRKIAFTAAGPSGLLERFVGRDGAWDFRVGKNLAGLPENAGDTLGDFTKALGRWRPLPDGTDRHYDAAYLLDVIEQYHDMTGLCRRWEAGRAYYFTVI